MDVLNNENACDMVNHAAKQVLRCRAPNKGRHRLEPSIAYPFRCPGCGYHFQTMANLRSHREAFGDATTTEIDELPDELFNDYEPVDEPCPGCGDPDCDFDCDGDYDPWT